MVDLAYWQSLPNTEWHTLTLREYVEIAERGSVRVAFAEDGNGIAHELLPGGVVLFQRGGVCVCKDGAIVVYGESPCIIANGVTS